MNYKLETSDILRRMNYILNTSDILSFIIILLCETSLIIEHNIIKAIFKTRLTSNCQSINLTHNINMVDYD